METSTSDGRPSAAIKKTLHVSYKVLEMLVDDYKPGLGPTTYSEVARRCGYEDVRKLRWFGQESLAIRAWADRPREMGKIRGIEMTPVVYGDRPYVRCKEIIL